MRGRVTAFLGYGAAVATILAAVALPLRLERVISRGVAATGVRVSPFYVGTEVMYTLQRDGYQIDVHRPFFPSLFRPRAEGFLQLTFHPAAALPAAVSEEIALNRDGPPVMALHFSARPDPAGQLHLTVRPLSRRVLPLDNVTTGRDMWPMILRVKGTLVVRVPLLSQAGAE